MSAVATPVRQRRADHLSSFKFLSVARSHAGCVREVNEDAFLNTPRQGLWAVADGMGGHDAGAAASQLVVEALAGVTSTHSAYAFRDGVTQRLHAANASLMEKSLSGLAGMSGSTIVALLAHRGHFACLWAGDSRAYLYRRGALRRLTRDHSVVQEMIDNGALTPERARGHPKANVITRAVGAHETLDVDGEFGVLRAGDRFLLCSDGLSSIVSEREIAERMMRAPLEAAAESLIERALARGAPDNVTVVLVSAEAAQGAVQ